MTTSSRSLWDRLNRQNGRREQSLTSPDFSPNYLPDPETTFQLQEVLKTARPLFNGSEVLIVIVAARDIVCNNASNADICQSVALLKENGYFIATISLDYHAFGHIAPLITIASLKFYHHKDPLRA
ncbi:hypothetical protein L596_027129 [Steinernema carpocapsae]|uniref:Uncharacterized protein n=1 Tax=Steinernema carpocapsae TaxID=34508 RepID=A0A4U5M3F1_STECR|nr:hypothetical protein L596_027129 [Steinernema carpocapsae]